MAWRGVHAILLAAFTVFSVEVDLPLAWEDIENQGHGAVKCFAAIVVSLGISSALPTHAQKLDLSKMTCAQFAESGRENAAIIVTWLSGFFTDEADPPIVDFDKIKRDVDKLGDYCRKNPTSELMEAAEETLDH